MRLAPTHRVRVECVKGVLSLEVQGVTLRPPQQRYVIGIQYDEEICGVGGEAVVAAALWGGGNA
jgi:hypothetical protein